MFRRIEYESKRPLETCDVIYSYNSSIRMILVYHEISIMIYHEIINHYIRFQFIGYYKRVTKHLEKKNFQQEWLANFMFCTADN